jgi:hypothetical protein
MRARSAALPMSGNTVVLSAFSALLAVAVATGCDRPNPLYHPHDGGGSGQAGDGPAGIAGTSGQAGDMGAAGDSGQAGDMGLAGTTGSAGTTDAGAAGAIAPDGGSDAAPAVCKQASDCLAARGPAPCGAWECRNNACAVMCAQCTDADHDGFGVGTGCAGPDCDDTNPNVGRSAIRACYDGKGGTMGVGPCRAGAQVCADGVWSGCNGQVLPSGEACNGLDDDCNGKPDDGLGTIACGLGVCAQTAPACSAGALGVCQPAAATAAIDDCDGKDNDCDGAIDEDCATACIRVTPNGDDGNATGTTQRPFRSIQAAINYATGGPNRPKAVCVAGGMTCADAASFQAPDAGNITMANGISVYGNYELKTWTRCPFGPAGAPTLNVTLEPRTAKGVVFPATVTTPTTLDGVRLVRFNGAGGPGGANAPVAGISVEGAKQVVISNVLISDAQDVATSYGVLLTGGAEALITRSSILGGAATTDSVGVRSVASKPTIRDNCNAVDPATGRCTGPCTATSQGIRGRVAQTAGARAVAVELIDSPGAIVERSALCGTTATNGFAVRVSGAATGTIVRGNWIAAAGANDSRGVSLDACGDASPWIVGNELIQADGTMRVAAVSALGACHPVIDDNVKITGGGEGSPALSAGVACGAAATVASRCAVIGNKLIQGSPSTHPEQSIAVACDGGACARIAGNRIVGQGGGGVVGLSLSGSGALVERNDITGGCGTKTTIGILADDTFARIENNLVQGASCGPGLATPSVDGLHVHVAAGGNEVDVHSNTILAGGAGACQGAAAGIGLGAAPGPRTPRGIFRDNILRAGACTIARYDFWEDSAGTTPRIFQNNDLDPGGTPTALYLTGDGKSISSAAMVNALSGASGNISADPMFLGANDFHLAAGSACVNAGTPAGAPRADYDGKARDEKPDIGAYEK